MKSLRTLTLLLGLSSHAFGHLPLPPLAGTTNELNAYIHKVSTELPWVQSSGILASMQARLGHDQVFLPGLVAMDSYKTLAKPHEPLTFQIDQVTEAKELVSVIPDAVLVGIKKTTLTTLQEIARQGSGDIRSAVESEVKARLARIVQADPKGILVGMINCLPKNTRAKYFKIASNLELLEALTTSQELTDDALKASFQGAAHQIQAAEVSKQFLIDRVRTLMEREKEMVLLLRAQWFLENTPDSEIAKINQDATALESVVAAAPSERFDINTADADRAKAYFASVRDGIPHTTGEAKRRSQAFLDRVEAGWREWENTTEERSVERGTLLFTIREVPAYIAVHRSALTADCGTTHDFPFPYSPIERNFFIFDKDGAAVGYIGATPIQTNGRSTLYVHDVTGRSLNQAFRDISVHVLHASLSHFGVDLMTVATNGYVPLQQYGNSVANTYLDSDIRHFFFQHAPGAHGDRPQDNPTSAEFAPYPERLPKFRFRVLGIETKIDPSKPETRPEQLHRGLGTLSKMNMLPDGYALPGFDVQTVAMLYRAIHNTDHVTLEAYYQRLSELFKGYDTQLTQNFIRRNDTFFHRGHLEASDALSTTEETLHERTVNYLIAIVRRGQDRALAFDLIPKDPAFFMKSAKFRAYLDSIPLGSEAHVDRLKKLIAAGIELSAIAPTAERLKAMASSPDPFLYTLAIEQLLELEGPDILDASMQERLSQALDNEKHETDEASLRAIRALGRARHSMPPTLESLRKSVKYEKNPEIAIRAAILLMRAGLLDERIKKAMVTYHASPEVPADLRAEGDRLFAELSSKQQTCEASLATAPTKVDAP